MKRFSPRRARAASRGFSLVETVLSIGLMSFGFLSLAPLLGVGLASSHLARANRETTQIAATLIESAKQGALTAGTATLDQQGDPCSAAQAVYTARSLLQTVTSTGSPAATGPLTRLTLQITAVAHPAAPRTYTALFLTPAGS
jgi:type II secretory pathway pseudopilin PulG